MEERLLSTGEFAQRSGVTVRALRYYDRLGLLPPASRRRDGRRGYGAQELVRLQQIVTLKSLGFTLQEVRSILRSPGYNLAHALQAQRDQLEQRIDTLQTIVRAIDRAQQSLAPDEIDWESFIAIIRATSMAQEHEQWLSRYYTDEQLEQLRQRPFTEEDQERAQAAWAQILEEAGCLAHGDEDPSGPRAQALAARFQGMIDQFTGGDPGIEAALQRMYSEPEEMPAEYRMGPDDEKTRLFTEAMMAAYRAFGPQS